MGRSSSPARGGPRRSSLAVGIVAILALGGALAERTSGAAPERRTTDPSSTATLSEAYRLLDSGRVHEAQVQFSTILAGDPTSLSAREGLVRAYVESGAREKAAAEADARLALSPDVAWRKRWIDVVMGVPGRHAAALAAARALVREWPADVEARVILARVLSVRGDGFRDAVEAYRDALRLSPGDTAIRTQLAHALVLSALYAEAIVEYRQVIADAADTWVQEDLARALVSAGRYDEAVTEYRAVVVRRPQDRRLRLDLARALSSANNPAEAIRIFDALIAEDPADVEVLRERALIARWDGDFRTAHRLLRQAAAAEHGDPEIRKEPGEVTPRTAEPTAAPIDITVPLVSGLLGLVMVIGHVRRTLCMSAYLGVLVLGALFVGAGLCWFHIAPAQ
jgi:Flp pilus assembly protein TadD